VQKSLRTTGLEQETVDELSGYWLHQLLTSLRLAKDAWDFNV